MSKKIENNLLVILGPTACGKTRLATQVAYALGGEIISADSRQVYRDMNIGTGKDLAEYEVQGQLIGYHLIDIVEAGDAYHVHRFQQDCEVAITDILGRHKVPILCGGTGLYIEAVLNQHQFTSVPIDDRLRQQLFALTDDELRHRFESLPSDYTPLADTSTRKRLIRAIEIATFLQKNPLPSSSKKELHYQIIGLDIPIEQRRDRITQRLYQRLEEGMVEEVAGLLNKGIPPEKLIYYGLEYKFITEHLLGDLDYGTMVERLNVAIHQFAKRQMTFFRKMERDGLAIHWLDALQPIDELVEEVKIIWKRYWDKEPF